MLKSRIGWLSRPGVLVFLLCAMCLWGMAQEQNNAARVVYQFDAAKLAAFTWKFTGANATDKNGELPNGWSANLWNEQARGEFAIADAPPGGKAIALRTLEGTPSAQFYNWQAVELPGGRKYQLSFTYYAPNGTAGGFNFHGQGLTETKETLGDTGGQWKTVTKEIETGGAAKLELQFQNYAGGVDKAIFLRDILVRDVGVAANPAPAVPANEAAAVTRNATSNLPDLKPATVPHPHYRAIVTEIQNLHPKLLLLDSDPDVALTRFQRNSVEGRATFTDVPVTGQAFKKALRIDSERKPQEWMTHIQSFTKAPIHRGDVIYVTAWVRALRITNGKPYGTGRLYASEERGGNGKNSSGLWGGDFDIPQEWTRVHFPLVATRDFGADDELKLMFTFGHTAQIVEIGGVTAINLGPGISKGQLPHAKLKLDYAGRSLQAPWRKAARERIEKIRKGNLNIVVTDAAGKPINNADVKVNMTRHNFTFGSSLPTGMLPGQNVKPWNEDFKRTAGALEEDKKKLQEVFLKHFNAATTSVTWTIWYGGDLRISREDILAGLKWLRQNNIACLDSQVVYPSPEFTPELAQKLMTKEKTAGFSKAIRDYIEFSAKELPVDSLQIANEIEGRPQYTDILGHDVVVDWFKWAKQANPNKPRMINGPYTLGDAVIQTGVRPNSWPKTEGLQYYYDLISWLKQKGAPIDYIGFQNHQSLGAPGPEAVLKTLDQFSTLKLPIEVTEFEVTLQNGNDPEQRKFQADYLRDYFTAVFSHPSVTGILLQDFWQPGAWQYEGASAFFNADWTINPHGKAYQDLVLNQWWTRTGGKTNKKGAYATRGFLGNYEITVTANGKTKTIQTALPKDGRAVTIQLDQ